jgi:hypothetical protein
MMLVLNAAWARWAGWFAVKFRVNVGFVALGRRRGFPSSRADTQGVGYNQPWVICCSRLQR